MFFPVLFTVLTLLVLAVVLSVILWAGSLWIQGMLYESPGEGLYWRAPAVGGGIAVFLGVWAAVDCATGGHVRPLHQTSVYQSRTYPKLKAVLKKNGPEQDFQQVGDADERLPQYREDGRRDGAKLPARPERIIVDDGGALAFEPERDAKGAFKTQQGENLRYLDKYGRVMMEGDLGEVSQFRWDWLFWNLLFNALHLALWFAGLWLVLRFQWSHALGFAVCFWAAMTLFPVGMVLDYAETAFHVVK